MYHLIVCVLNDCSLFHCVFLGVIGCHQMWAESARFLKQNFIPFSPQNSSFSLWKKNTLLLPNRSGDPALTHQTFLTWRGNRRRRSGLRESSLKSRRRLTSLSRLPLLLRRQMRTVKMRLSLRSVIKDAKIVQDQNWAGASNQIQTHDTICIGRRAVQLSHGPSPLRSHCAAQCLANNSNRIGISRSIWGYTPGRDHSAVQCAPRCSHKKATWHSTWTTTGGEGGTAAAPVANPLPDFIRLNTISMFVGSCCSLIAARWRWR